MNTVTPHLRNIIEHLLFLPRRCGRLGFRDPELIQIAPAALASEFGIVCRGYDTDRSGRARIEVASRVDALLNFVRTEPAFVIQDGVMRGPHVTLQARVGLEIQVKIEAVKKRVEFSWGIE